MSLKIFTKKRIIWSIVVLIVGFIGFSIYNSKKNAGAANVQTDTVKRQDIQTTVLSTGQVVSLTDLSLSFQSSGIISKINIKEGQAVKARQILATLLQNNVAAALTSAQGSLAQAEANYQKVLAGASNEQINVAQKAVDAAKTSLDNSIYNLEIVKQQQNTLVENAYNTLLNSSLALVPGPSNSSGANPTIGGTYIGKTEGQYKVTLFSSGAVQYSVSGLGNAFGQIPVNASSPVAIGNGLFLYFPTATYRPDDYWTIDIPNTKASTYLTNYNAYQSALQTKLAAIVAAETSVSSYKTALAQAEANLEQTRAQARPADVAVARAQVLSAQGTVASALASYENSIIRAPVDGTVTQITYKVGEQAVAGQEAMRLQNIGDVHVEANVSEANVAALKVGQTVDYTFDALGPDRHFKGTILSINPASTVISGVVNYKVTADFEPVPDIKPGMTANMTVLVAEKKGALTVPSSALINEGGQQFVRVITNPIKKTYEKVVVTTGLNADGGLVEILSGVSENQEVVTYIK